MAAHVRPYPDSCIDAWEALGPGASARATEALGPGASARATEALGPGASARATEAEHSPSVMQKDENREEKGSLQAGEEWEADNVEVGRHRRLRRQGLQQQRRLPLPATAFCKFPGLEVDLPAKLLKVSESRHLEGDSDHFVNFLQSFSRCESSLLKGGMRA
jgi:hypothetical protein